MIKEYHYMLPKLETERLLLLPLKAEYTEGLIPLQCKGVFENGKFVHKPIEEKEAMKEINSLLRKAKTTKLWERWVIALKNENGYKIIGQIHIVSRGNVNGFNFCKEIDWYRIGEEY